MPSHKTKGLHSMECNAKRKRTVNFGCVVSKGLVFFCTCVSPIDSQNREDYGGGLWQCSYLFSLFISVSMVIMGNVWASKLRSQICVNARCEEARFLFFVGDVVAGGGRSDEASENHPYAHKI